MNKKIYFIVIYFVTNIFLIAEENNKKIDYVVNYFTYSAVGNISIAPIEFNNPGFTLGLESLFDFTNDKHNHLIGVDYRLTFYNKDENTDIYHSLQWYYCFLPNLGFNDFIFFPLWEEINSFPFGINMIYNFNSNLFSIGPKVSYYLNLVFMFMSFDYTYNITVADYSKSFHQFSIKAGANFGIFF
jgi:hypothetical protein